MSRREAREQAFSLLYQLEFREEPIEEQIELYSAHHPLDTESQEFFESLVKGVFTKREELDTIYSPFLKGWKMERLPKIDVVLLRMATYEIKNIDDIPSSVSISEAVILAKRYSTEEARGYINAVLGKIAGETPT